MRSLGDLDIELKHGTFKAYAFENSVDGKHLIALTKGDISTAEPLLMRIHSECITSETLGGCDCDCVEQLDGALKRIAEEGRGVLFYLRQEGRGAGYSAKGRDRMCVAASENQVETFEAYRQLGLAPDLRRYEQLVDVAYLLDIKAPLRVMTNNPDKLEGLRSIGFETAEQCSLSLPPNPFNSYYLATKSKNGHMFDAATAIEAEYPWSVDAFTPYRVVGAMRFTHNASYPLPIRPNFDKLILDVEELSSLQRVGSDLIKKMSPLGDGRFSVEVNPTRLESLAHTSQDNNLAAFLAKNCYWFNDHIYNDSVTGSDFVALTYRSETAKDIEPLVRVHSENLLQRFPVADSVRSRVYERSVQAIVEHGYGMILLYPEDGRGNGFGTAFLEQRLVQKGVVDSAEEASKLIGAPADSRQYDALASLIKNHFDGGPIRLVFTSPESIAKKEPLLNRLQSLGVQLLDPIFVGDK